MSRDMIIVTILAVIVIILLFLVDAKSQMHNEELFDAEVTVGWFWEKVPVYMGFHAIGETEDGITRWVHIEGIPLLITVMEFTSGEWEEECDQLEQ